MLLSIETNPALSLCTQLFIWALDWTTYQIVQNGSIDKLFDNNILLPVAARVGISVSRTCLVHCTNSLAERTTASQTTGVKQRLCYVSSFEWRFWRPDYPLRQSPQFSNPRLSLNSFSPKGPQLRLPDPDWSFPRMESEFWCPIRNYRYCKSGN